LNKKRFVVFLISLLFILFILGWLTDKPLYSYLSLHHPIYDADILIAEGWLSRKELLEVAHIFKKDNYSLLVTTGTPSKDEYLMGKNGELVFHLSPPLIFKET